MGLHARYNFTMTDIEVCPICLRPYSKKNHKVKYHLQYHPVPKYIYACDSCNYAEYLSRHWKRHLSPWQWYKIYLVRKFARENQHLLEELNMDSH